MSAISCASLIIRQPAVTGVAALEARRGRGLRDPVRERERQRLLDADRARRRAAVAQDRGDERVGRLVLLPRAHVACRSRICSSARAFSNAGVTHAGSPSRVSTAPKKRSLSPHSAPVK